MRADPAFDSEAVLVLSDIVVIGGARCVFFLFPLPPAAHPILSSFLAELQSLSFNGRVHKHHLASRISLSTLLSLSSLTRLSLSHVRRYTAPPPLPHVHTLLLSHSVLDKTPACFPFFASFPSLHTLAWDETAPTPSAAFFSHTPPTLRHLLLGIPTAVHYGLEESALLSMQDKPPLRSLTFRASALPVEAVAGNLEQIRARCRDQAVRFELIVAPPDKFDVERWSLEAV